MSLQPGTCLGPYEVAAQIGVGGMGEVYRATDTKLDRDVALKVLPQAFTHDPDRLARFEREAKVLASLNHPNIAAIYGLEHTDGVTALIMELVEGEDLSQRIARGAIPVDEALPIAKQVAEALEAAHERGIIHRDLKPANIKVRDDGTVKVLDFGLAKAMEPAGSSSSVSMSPTIATPAQTMQGVILGTAPYMSPEQARGKAVDRRADMWAFGCVVYEMLTAKRAFEGEDVSLTLSAVLQREPDWSALPVALPSALGIFLRRCLQKDPRQRIGDAQDMRLALEGVFETPAAHNAAVGAAEPTGWWRTAGVAVVAAVVGGLAVGLMSWEWRTAAPTETVRFDLLTSDGVQLRVSRQALDLTVTPDGTKVVYSAEGDGVLAVRALDQLRATPLATSNAFEPVVSPDGAWVAYTDISDGTLKKMSIQGGPPITICPVAGFPRGASWGEDGTIVFATSDLTTGLLRVADGGGDPVVLTTPDESTGWVDHFFPDVLPGGRAIIFTRLLSRDGSRSEIVLLDLASQEQRVLVAEGSHAQYATSGHLVYGVNGTLRAVAFDLARLTVQGNPVPVLEGVLAKGTGMGAADFSLARNGALVYVTGSAGETGERGGRPVWVSRDGREDAALVDTDLTAPEFPRLSPDNQSLALVVDGDVWVYDVGGRPPIKLTFDGDHYSPLWSPDGRRLVFESASPQGLFAIAADGSGQTPEPMSAEDHFHPHAWTQDELLAVQLDLGHGASTDNDIVRWPLGEPDARQPVVATPAREGGSGASLSPDGRWLAYTSNQTGQDEVWVRPYPGPGAPVRVSPDGGVEPVWSKGGQELYYLEGTHLMAVPVTMGATFVFKPPTLLFENPYYTSPQPPSYDVAADGRFLMIKGSGPDAVAAPSIVVVLNWFEELKARVPVP